MQQLTANEVKASVTMPDILAHYGIASGRKHRIPCPLHNGKDNNFAYTDTFYKCFVCGESGDVISFVQKYKGITFREAMLELNNLLHAGDGTADLDQIKIKAEYQKALKRQAVDELTNMIGQRWHYLDVLSAEAPENINENPSEEWLKALHEVDWLTVKILEKHREIEEKWGGTN